VNNGRRTFIQGIAALSAGVITSAKALAMPRQRQTMPCMPGMSMPGCVHWHEPIGDGLYRIRLQDYG